ncbi:hypothetical protein M758_5G053800 [Ceratodon purpureus]|nr:hypothetical protein M758_5G053800 [Ceratodon purpureus]
MVPYTSATTRRKQCRVPSGGGKRGCIDGHPKAEQTCSICNSSPPSSPSSNPRTTTTVCLCLCLWPGNPHLTPKLIYLITTHSIPSFPLPRTVNSCPGYSALCFTRGLDWIELEWSGVESWRTSGVAFH